MKVQKLYNLLELKPDLDYIQVLLLVEDWYKGANLPNRMRLATAVLDTWIAAHQEWKTKQNCKP